MSVIGDRDSGKSKIFLALKHAFGGYVATFNAGVLLAGHTTGDGNRDAVIFQEVELARLAFSKEVKSKDCLQRATVINGDIVKMWQTAGDVTRARDVCEKSREVLISSLLATNGNDMPRMVPGDAYEHMAPIRFPNKFVYKSVKRQHHDNPKLREN